MFPVHEWGSGAWGRNIGHRFLAVVAVGSWRYVVAKGQKLTAKGQCLTARDGIGIGHEGAVGTEADLDERRHIGFGDGLGEIIPAEEVEQAVLVGFERMQGGPVFAESGDVAFGQENGFGPQFRDWPSVPRSRRVCLRIATRIRIHLDDKIGLGVDPIFSSVVGIDFYQRAGATRVRRGGFITKRQFAFIAQGADGGDGALTLAFRPFGSLHNRGNCGRGRGNHIGGNVGAAMSVRSPVGNGAMTTP